MFKKDSIGLGLGLGIALPFLFFLFLTGINMLIGVIWNEGAMITRETVYLISIFINLLPIRVYFVSYKYDKTGRGVLLITFILMIIFFTVIKPH